MSETDIPDYDAGLLNDFGGGNVDWWWDYIRAEIDRANAHWREAITMQPAPISIEAAVKAALEDVADTIQMFAPLESLPDSELSEVGRIRREMWRKQDEAIRAMIAARAGKGE